MDEEQNKNTDGFFEQNEKKGSEFAKEKAKKQAKKKIISKILTKKAKTIIGIVIIAIIGVVIFVSGSLYLVDKWKETNVNNSKKSSVVMSYDGKVSVAEQNTIVIKPTEDKGAYEISNTYTEEIDDIREELKSETTKDVSKFTDFEVIVIKSFADNGLDIDSFTTEQLKCLSVFLKAESCTQFLDLRPNSEKQQGKNTGEYIDNYEPKKKDQLLEDEVPGIILVQRTNTNSTEYTAPITLEYKKLEEFNTMVSNNDVNIKNYFTVNEAGNLVIAKWDQIKVEVTADKGYPENLPEEEKIQPNEQTMILTTEIPYREYIKQYTMPFDFLTQLLIITEDTDFCLDVADIVLGSKIVINIQEEETVTTTVEERKYEVHSKENKYLYYNIQPNLENGTNHFINPYGKKDENGIECTTYAYDEKEVTIKTTNISHTYDIGILEADTWIARYKKEYVKQTPQPENKPAEPLDSDGEYVEEQEKIITDTIEISKDEEAEKFRKDKVEEYTKNIPNVDVKVKTHKKGLGSDKNYKEIVVTPKNKVTTNLSQYEFDEIEIKDDKGNVIGYKYDMPTSFEVKTIKTKECPFEVKFIYGLGNNYQYKINYTNKDSIVVCNISKLLIKPYTKINLRGTITTDIVEYPSDPNPTTNTYMYARDTNNECEKFLKAYDNNKKAREMMNSIDSWLFEVMEENENTKHLVPAVKVLLFKYDGIDRGITELDLTMFAPSAFTSVNGIGTGYWWPIGSDVTEDINGVTYAKGEPSSTNITSNYGPRGISPSGFHYGIDIGGNKDTNIIAARSGVVQRVVDGYGDGKLDRSYLNKANYVIIKHDDGMSTAYWHLQKGIKVSEGDKVEQGQVIGKMGNSGYSSGVHLHFEVRDANGNKPNPTEYVSTQSPRPMYTTSSLRDWLWGIEGGSQYIKGTTWIVFDPDGNGDNTMNLAHGMVIADYNGANSWYPEIIPGKITVGQTVTEEQANKVWEVKIKGFNNAIDIACAQNDVSLTANQKDALVSYIYRTGYGKGQNNKIVQAYKNGGNAGLWNYMKEGYHRQYETGTKNRIAEEYELFVKGDYTYQNTGVKKYNEFCSNPNI